MTPRYSPLVATPPPGAGSASTRCALALEYRKRNPDTLIVVTADHSHSTQIVPDGNGGKQTATLLTADGDPMSVAYSTQLSARRTPDPPYGSRAATAVTVTTTATSR